jgi:hypothetical protein
MISLTLKDRWKGPHGITYPKGTVFWMASLGGRGTETTWGYITPDGGQGKTLFEEVVIPGAKESIDA